MSESNQVRQRIRNVVVQYVNRNPSKIVTEYHPTTKRPISVLQGKALVEIGLEIAKEFGLREVRLGTARSMPVDEAVDRADLYNHLA